MHYTLLVLADDMDEVERLMAPYQENNMDDVPREYLKFFDFSDETWHDEETGNEGCWENPDAKWDCYEFGGRWDRCITTKDGRHVSSCPVAEIDASKTWAKDGVPFSTYAVLTPDGEWHDSGTLDHDGMAYKAWRDSFAGDYIEPYLDKTAYLIDYHI